MSHPKPQDARLEKAVADAIGVGYEALAPLLAEGGGAVVVASAEGVAKKAIARAVLHGMEALGIDTATVNVVTSGKVNVHIR